MSGRGITAVVSSVRALALTAVCVAGDRAALHFSTAQGQLSVNCPLADLLTHARAECDHHGRPFETPVAKRRARTEAQLIADAASSVPTGDFGAPSTTARLPRGEITRRCERGWADFKADPTARLSDLAARHAIHPGTFQAYVSQHHAVEFNRLRVAAGALGQLRTASITRAKYHPLWLRYISTPDLTLKDLARQSGTSTTALCNHFKRYAAEPGAPVLRPNGRL